ncbi:MAG: restriction endonuclease [Ignavibacteriaceae bacterium]|nr:restriction endonuclease [Ignavibacteriaceae bacterium]
MVPDFQSIMLPLLKLLGDNQTHKVSDLTEKIADSFALSAEERNERLPSGVQTKLENRTNWSASYLKHAGLIEYPARGHVRITKSGMTVLKSPPQRIDRNYLNNFTPYVKWQETIKANKKKTGVTAEPEELAVVEETPDERMESSYSDLNRLLKSEIIEKIKTCSPKFFEGLVVDLFLKMGYGGSQAEAGEVLGKSNDGGIDGIIKEDRLGLDTIYIQAKKWENMVPISQVRDFAGALLAKKAKKGIFITTSSFPKSAHDFVASIDPRIVLIDGEQLADLMIEHDLGVSVRRTYQVKKLDIDYYEE